MPKTIHTEAYATLTEVLAEARLGQGLTQQAVADRLGRPQSFIAKIERGERRLDVIEFYAVILAIGLDPAAVFQKVASRLTTDLRI